MLLQRTLINNVRCLNITSDKEDLARVVELLDQMIPIMTGKSAEHTLNLIGLRDGLHKRITNTFVHVQTVRNYISATMDEEIAKRVEISINECAAQLKNDNPLTDQRLVLNLRDGIAQARWGRNVHISLKPN